MVIDGSLGRPWPQDNHLMRTFWTGPPPEGRGGVQGSEFEFFPLFFGTVRDVTGCFCVSAKIHTLVSMGLEVEMS